MSIYVPEMKISAKLEARLLIECLVKEGSTFDAGKGRCLIELVPVRYVFNDNAPRNPGPLGGFTSEMGNMSYDDPRGRHDNGYYPERVSAFGIHHEPGMMVIANREGMGRTTLRSAGTVCSLDYDSDTREPSGMRLMQVKLKLWHGIPVGFIGALEPWKTPVRTTPDTSAPSV